MESNHTLHGSELVPHWVLGPKKSKFGPMGSGAWKDRYQQRLDTGFEMFLKFASEHKLSHSQARFTTTSRT